MLLTAYISWAPCGITDPIAQYSRGMNIAYPPLSTHKFPVGAQDACCCALQSIMRGTTASCCIIYIEGIPSSLTIPNLKGTTVPCHHQSTSRGMTTPLFSPITLGGVLRPLAIHTCDAGEPPKFLQNVPLPVDNIPSITPFPDNTMLTSLPIITLPLLKTFP